MPERPACLFFRASDERLNVYKNLVLPEYLEKRKVCSTDVERLRRIMPMNHEVLRPIRPGERAHIDHPGRKFDIVPYPEAQARAEEIVSAWDGWCAAKATIAVQHQQPELDAAADAAEGATIAIAHRIAAQPAQTAAGFRVKIRALAHYNTSFLWTSVPELPDPDQTLAHSLWRDVREERLPAADPTDWNSPPPGFMAYPADDPQGFVIIREGLRMELERLHRIALAEYARKVGPDASEATRSRVRQELRLDILAPAPLREEAFTATPALNDLSAQILALWPVWAAHTGDEGTDEQTVAYEAIQERRFNLLDTVDALPATPENIQPKALALAWLHYVNEWRRGQKRSEYCIDERLAIDIHIAALAQGETRETAARRPEPSLLGMLDLASATMDELRVIHDVADLVGGVAYAVTWQGRCKPRGQWGDHNAAGKLMQWLGDALTDVETATNEEAARRSPSNSHDRERRLAMRAVNIIESNETDRLTAFAHELLAHAEAERQGR